MSAGAPPASGIQRTIAGVPGVGSVEPLHPRFAYVGPDLQDLYGVRPATVAGATGLQDAYFQGGSARHLLTTLASRPDAIRVSAETVRDFQLNPGDLLRLRLQDGHTGKLVMVPFHYAGIVKEFPTAPRDSFFVANAAYVAARTGSPAVGEYLVSTDGTAPPVVASRLRAALGFAERRRTFALARVLGAQPRQLGGFVWAEVVITGLIGAGFGAVTGWLLSQMLVKVLTGVFDPPPAHLSVPWAYLGVVAALAVAGLAAAGGTAIRAARRPPLTVLRDL